MSAEFLVLAAISVFVILAGPSTAIAGNYPSSASEVGRARCAAVLSKIASPELNPLLGRRGEIVDAKFLGGVWLRIPDFSYHKDNWGYRIGSTEPVLIPESLSGSVEERTSYTFSELGFYATATNKSYYGDWEIRKLLPKESESGW